MFKIKHKINGKIETVYSVMRNDWTTYVQDEKRAEYDNMEFLIFQDGWNWVYAKDYIPEI